MDDGAAARVTGWLENAEDAAAQAVEIRLTSDNADDLTLRQARLLGSADVLAYERGIATDIVNRARADARVDLGATDMAQFETVTDVLRDRHMRPEGVGLEHHRGVPLFW